MLKVPLCKVEEIPEEGAKTVAFLDREVLAFKIEGRLKAVVNICTHLGGPLRREVNRLVCELHCSEFDCRTGQCLKGPAHPESRLLTLPTFVENGMLTYAVNFECQPGDGFSQLLPHLVRQIDEAEKIR
jgi:nitrite reductase/ring-hydroxylating ferredoxin subunit